MFGRTKQQRQSDRAWENEDVRKAGESEKVPDRVPECSDGRKNRETERAGVRKCRGCGEPKKVKK